MVGKGEPLGAMPDRAQSPALGQTPGRRNTGWERRRPEMVTSLGDGWVTLHLPVGDLSTKVLPVSEAEGCCLQGPVPDARRPQGQDRTGLTSPVVTREGTPFAGCSELRIRVEPAPGHSVQLQPALALGTAPEIHSLSCHLTSNSAPGSRGYGQTSVGSCQRRPSASVSLLPLSLGGGGRGLGWNKQDEGWVYE